ncbi:hypothetical protein EMCRGX_G008326 [Ephydatia muelleri]
MSATLTWKREDIVYCRCSDMRSVHSHCPCGMCNGSAVSRSTEYRHWEIATKCASNLAFTSTASPSSSLVIPEMPMCIPNVVSDDKTMSGDELEACSSEIATVANSNQSSPFTTATDCGDVETMLEAEDFCAGGIECTLQNEDGSFPIENVERMHGTVVDHKVKCIIREAVLGAMKIQSEFSSSRAHFLRVLNYGRDLFCKGDPNIIKYWPKTWQDCISLLSGEGYTEAIQYWICLNREHPCCYDITNSPEELCNYLLPNKCPISLDPFLEILVKELEDLFVNGAQGSESTHYYYGNYRYHSRYPSDESDLNMFVQTMKDIECEDRPTVHATMARESGFTGLSILHRLYAAYGFNILKDLTFDAMHDVTLNIIHHHLLRYLEAGILSRNEIDVRLAAIPWTPVTGPLLPNQDKWTEMAKVTNPGKRRNAGTDSLADARVCYGQVKKLRWDDDDSIVKHKLATMAVRE